MRRKYLSDKEMNRVVKLRQSGASWLRIEKDTGIPRRSAKRAYGEWERTKSVDELKEARTDVAREEFRKHLKDLIRMAENVLGSLAIPSWPTERRRAQEFLHQQWTKEDCTGYASDERRVLRHNLMLLEALKGHTGEKVRWQALEEWQQEWNSCIDVLGSLSEEAEGLMENILNQMPKLKKRIEQGGVDKVSRKALVEGILAVVWSGIEEGAPREAPSQIRTTRLGSDKTVVLFGDRAARASLPFIDRQLGEDVAKACAWAARNLCEGDGDRLIKAACEDVSMMRARIEELDKMLDPLLLTPLILRTTCDLCPVQGMPRQSKS